MNTQKSIYQNQPELAQSHLLEIYKLYVDMADRLSARRQQINAFFMTLHTSAIAALCVAFFEVDAIESKWLIYLPFLLGIVLCAVWILIINTFRQINKAKFATIAKLEEALPVSPFAEIEWDQLGCGRDWWSYIPTTFLEMVVPSVFALVHGALMGYFAM